MRLGIDIGGTKAVIAIVQDDGGIVAKDRVAMDTYLPCSVAIQHIAAALQSLLRAQGGTVESVSFLGIGVPGTVDRHSRTVLHAPNLGWEKEPVAAYFEAELGLSPRLVQDTRAAALAEALAGAGKGRHCVACITLGTGIGCGIVQEGRIYSGALCTAGEVGHIPVYEDGLACSCGRRGCMEAYASGTGIARMAQARNIAQTSEEVFALAAQGHGDALSLLNTAITAAGRGICALINILSPDAVLFSGGLCAQDALYVRPLIEYIRTHAYALAVSDALLLCTASLGADAPVIGAALLDASL